MIRQALLALLAGTLFGAGLAISGMADPQRVRGFLDLFGAWDPTLAFVMVGAIVPMVVAWKVRIRIAQPLFASEFTIPATRRIDPRLIAGAVLFGMGWGLAGLCPGPAIADLAIAPVPASIFVLAMLAGMFVHRMVVNRRSDAVRSGAS